MVYRVTLKGNIHSEIDKYFQGIERKIEVATLNITDGLLKKGSYYIPVEHILFIEEV